MPASKAGQAGCAGLMLSSHFPVNYFSMGKLDQLDHPPVLSDFQELYASTGKGLKAGGPALSPLPGKFWCFNMLHASGYTGENAQALSNVFKLKLIADKDVAAELEIASHKA